jgi:hypothetical protein
MTFYEVFLLLLVNIFHLLHPPLAEISHYLFLFRVTKFVIILVVLMTMIMKQVAFLGEVVELTLLVLKLLFNLDGLILDGLFHNHV